MCNETTRGLETPERREVSTVPVGTGTDTGRSEPRRSMAVSLVPEASRTPWAALMSGTVFGSGMASNSQTEER